MPLCIECRKLEIDDSALDGTGQHALAPGMFGYSGSSSEPWDFGLDCYCLVDELPRLPGLTKSAEDHDCEGCRFFKDAISGAEAAEVIGVTIRMAYLWEPDKVAARSPDVIANGRLRALIVQLAYHHHQRHRVDDDGIPETAIEYLSFDIESDSGTFARVAVFRRMVA